MLSNITWTPFLVVLGSITLLYYIIYCIKYYAKNFLEKLNTESSEYDEVPLSQNEVQNEHPEDDDLLKLEALVNEIKSDILVKAGESVTKEQLFEALVQKVANYDGLHQPAYRYALNNFIIQHSKKICGVVIEEEELENLWNKQSH